MKILISYQGFFVFWVIVDPDGTATFRDELGGQVATQLSWEWFRQKLKWREERSPLLQRWATILGPVPEGWGKCPFRKGRRIEDGIDPVLDWVEERMKFWPSR